METRYVNGDVKGPTADGFFKVGITEEKFGFGRVVHSHVNKITVYGPTLDIAVTLRAALINDRMNMIMIQKALGSDSLGNISAEAILAKITNLKVQLEEAHKEIKSLKGEKGWT